MGNLFQHLLPIDFQIVSSPHKPIFSGSWRTFSGCQEKVLVDETSGLVARVKTLQFLGYTRCYPSDKSLGWALG